MDVVETPRARTHLQRSAKHRRNAFSTRGLLSRHVDRTLKHGVGTVCSSAVLGRLGQHEQNPRRRKENVGRAPAEAENFEKRCEHAPGSGKKYKKTVGKRLRSRDMLGKL